MYDSSTQNLGKTLKVRETHRERWFSGAFTYYMPSGYNTRNVMYREAQRVKKLLGLTIDPEVVWNLAPWSWAADWFSSSGDVLSNISDWASDGLVLRYGYMMEFTSTHDSYYHTGPTGLLDSSIQPSSVTLVAETKLRRRATPFGFGLTWSGLTPRQLAIAAALGLSR